MSVFFTKVLRCYVKVENINLMKNVGNCYYGRKVIWLDSSMEINIELPSFPFPQNAAQK